jgi:diguanylate cyclase (GGDEF)-like protein
MQLTTSSARFVPVRLSPGWAAVVSIVALLLVFAADRATDAAPVQHLYYLPIIFAGINFGMRGGIVAAVTAIALYHKANPHLLSFHYGESDLVQIVLFLAVGVITAKLTGDADRLRGLALTDDLTGLHNLRSFEQRLVTLVGASRRTHVPLALLVLDLDRLKSINDKYGHLAGAEAVRTVGQILGQRLPPAAVACRYGGDEFVIAIPDCTSILARGIAEDLRQAVHECAPVLAGRAFGAGALSISIGACCVVLGGADRSRTWPTADIGAAEALFREADAALYRAKAAGRNQVWVA